MRRAVLLVPALVLMASPVWGQSGPAGADASREQARDAYDLGTAAYKRGDYARAAQAYARADELAPSDVALESALDSALLADDAVLASELADRAARRSVSEAIGKLVASARAKFAHKTGLVRVACPAKGCQAEIDGKPAEIGAVRHVLVGQHVAQFHRGSSAESLTFQVAPDQTVDVSPRTDLAAHDGPPPSAPAPEQHQPAPAPSRGGISPVWFVTGAVVTAGLGVGAAVSWSDALRQHERFDASGCDRTPKPGCAEASREGIAAENRTSWLLGGAVAAGAVTAVLGLFLVRWKDATAVAIGAGHDVVTVSWRTQ
jgi:hypothetical protein